MLLLDKESTSSNNIRVIAIISSREEVSSAISQLLRTRGFENVKVINSNFLAIDKVTFSAEETLGVIVDIDDNTDLKLISQHIYSFVPQHVWCCAVGQNDSISLAQKLLNNGILYFHSDSQLNELVDKIVSGVNIPLVRNTVRISVLGCKGGIGTSLISAHLANEIALNKKVPVLLAQGSNGSQDLDLLFDKSLQADSIVEYGINLDLFNGDPNKLDEQQISKYNFVIYDQPIFNVHKEKFLPFLEYSNTFVLVVERRINSLRVAKQFLDECERIRNTTGKLIRTFVCISDNKLETSKLMATIDIETLLKSPVDAVFPFLKQTDVKNVLAINLGKEGKKEMDALVMKVIGAVSRNSRQKEKTSFISSIYRTLVNK